MSRWKRWSDKGIFARMMDGLAAEAPKTVTVDATSLKAHRTATSLRSKKWEPATRRPEGRSDRPTERRHEHQAARRERRRLAPGPVLHDSRPGQ